jgi:hypothetical protein
VQVSEAISSFVVDGWQERLGYLKQETAHLHLRQVQVSQPTLAATLKTRWSGS